jgi:hypothetical protein
MFICQLTLWPASVSVSLWKTESLYEDRTGLNLRRSGSGLYRLHSYLLNCLIVFVSWGCTKYGCGVVGSPSLIRGEEKENKDESEDYKCVFCSAIKLVKLGWTAYRRFTGTKVKSIRLISDQASNTKNGASCWLLWEIKHVDWYANMLCP